MKSRRRTRTVFLAMLAAAALATALHAAPAKKPGSRPTAARTDAACLAKALGGMENIARIGSLYARYQFEAGGHKGTDVFWRDVRGAVRESLEVPGAISELTVFDGVRAWRRGSNGVVVPMSGADLEDVVTDAYLGIYMNVVPGRIQGRVDRAGLDRATGLVKMRVAPQGGTVVMLMVDTLTCLPARIVHATAGRTETIHLRDWRTVSGIKVPHVIHHVTGDTARDSKMTLLEARFDVPIPAGAFAKPIP